jgi:hypothetical protein
MSRDPSPINLCIRMTQQFEMRKFESRAPAGESWRIPIPRCRSASPAAPASQSVPNAYGIGSRSKCHEMATGEARRYDFRARAGDGDAR